MCIFETTTFVEDVKGKGRMFCRDHWYQGSCPCLFVVQRVVTRPHSDGCLAANTSLAN